MGRGFKLDSKLTTNNCFSLDINWMKKNRYLIHGEMVSVTINQRFRNSGERLSITTVSSSESVIVSYKIGEKELHYVIPVVFSDCNYGGARPWFKCPNTNCNRRVGKLYLRGQYFLCRHCHQLAYETQNISEPFRWLEKAQNIRERLGAESLSTMDPLPSKPKGMHYKTYLKLVNQYHYYNNASWGMMAQHFGIVI